ncbi:DUF3179 domain-containing protein [Marinilabiliaceae bacterium JC017]|nr:DUF3179 domain-containing protein [Marinilabiliaceae bacterium JC017]
MKRIGLFLGALIVWAGSCEKGDEDMLLPKFNTHNAVPGVVVIEDEFQGQQLVLAGDAVNNFIVSFSRKVNGELHNFVASDAGFPIIMEDEKGNQWDIFGEAVEGPDKGQQLVATNAIMGYWFSIATFFPGTEIYPDNDPGKHAGETITGTDGWLVPKNEVVSGGPGIDGIPSVDNPMFTDAAGQESFLKGTDLVVGIKIGDEIRAYPHDILDWHEIVNDQVDDTAFAIIYCPLTGTAAAWDRKIQGVISTFGVSGLLYNSNIVPYDRKTHTRWSQLLDKGVFGELSGKSQKHFHLVETTWSTWKQLYPDTWLMSSATGHARSYGNYPYGDYRNSARLIFDVKYEDDRLHAKERVHAIFINGVARVYRFESFAIKPAA